ncbi:hypothetical protein [Hansschlegelia plantiphila]|nr:hypothetical protein [Hansschlegelia plantiphila]
MEYNSKKEFSTALTKAISGREAAISGIKELKMSPSLNDFIKNLKPGIKDLSKDIFGYVPNNAQVLEICKLAHSHFSKEIESVYSTGVVIAGFGEDELFPSMYQLVVDGKLGSFTRIWHSKPPIDVNKNKDHCGVIPFAQKDMAHLFMEGIAPSHLIFAREIFSRVLREKSNSIIKDYVHDEDQQLVEGILQDKENAAIIEGIGKEFMDFRKESYVDPIIETISALPKEEMAFMAKSLVELTALRSRFASVIESVGGEIDVAIITKSDGFIWISRKHYFNLALNGEFLHRKDLQRRKADAKKDGD